MPPKKKVEPKEENNNQALVEPVVDKFKGDPKDIEANKGVALLSYVFILFLIPLFLRRKSHFAHYHAKQGLVLFVVEIIVFLLQVVPVIGILLLLAVFFLSIVGIYKCLEGQYWQTPYLHKFADKIDI